MSKNTLFIVHELQIFQSNSWEYYDSDCDCVKFWSNSEKKGNYVFINKANFFETLANAQGKLKKDVEEKTYNYKKNFDKNMLKLANIDYNPVICK